MQILKLQFPVALKFAPVKLCNSRGLPCDGLCLAGNFRWSSMSRSGPMLHWLQSASQCVPAKPQTDHGCLGGMASVLKLLRLSSALIALAFSCSHEIGRSQVQGELVADAVKLQGVQLAFLQNVCLSEVASWRACACCSSEGGSGTMRS